MDFNKLGLNKLIEDKSVLIGGSVALGVVVFVIVFSLVKGSGQNQANTQAATQEEVKRLVQEVGKLIDLPSGEDPTVATVTDISKLSNQPFFARAKNGDKVLIYSNAKKAYLYDPNAKKVIDVAPINLGSPSAQEASPSASP